jgi:hypothetical protein
MSKFKIFGKKESAQERQFEEDKMVNFMNGISYKINPFDSLKIVAASSIFGEPSYYRDSHDSEKYIKRMVPWLEFHAEDDETTTNLFIEIVDQALDHDFKGTLDFAKELRLDYFIRLNPALILIRAAMHAKRKEFNLKNKDYFREIGKAIILRPDDISNQFDLYLFFNKSKNKLPSILKRIWKDKLEGFTKYQISKYKSKSIIDLVRISHAHNEIIDGLMQTSTLKVSDTEKTWENLRSEKHSWSDILEMTHVPHMALLRNLRNIFIKEIKKLVKAKRIEIVEELVKEKLAKENPLAGELIKLIEEKKIGIDFASSESYQEIEKIVKKKVVIPAEYQTIANAKIEEGLFSKIIAQLSNGVKSGKQFPFRYYSAYNEIENHEVHYKGQLLDCLENCLDISVENFPKLKGKTICLSDNSGSSWGAIPSEYGSVTIAIIANLSSIITALQSDEGYVGVFGDKLNIQPVTRRNGILKQLTETNERGKQQGGSTENGIWLFFSDAINKKEHYDNIFIYSDMQAGHGGLYGINAGDYKNYTINGTYIDVLKLITDYRQQVNPKVNVFSVQVAGYNNSVTPENLYRSSILTGWTGKEVLYANYLTELWDSIEKR